ncbi:MAG: protein phosphatase 2C domain-containing protein [Hyphomicrobium sp.]|jgi:hypothetical protein
MRLTVVEHTSNPSGTANEDRAGIAGRVAWVIDGATDVISAPLTPATTDASWFADIMHTRLVDMAPNMTSPLSSLPQVLAEEIAPAFARLASRPPIGPEEHPSAAAIVIRLDGPQLEYVTLGDCALIAEGADGRLHHIGDAAEHAGDRWVADAIKQHLAATPSATSATFHDHLWPKLRHARARMNAPDGYGVFSITPAPARFIRTGSIALRPGSRVLLATDGLMRLVDVFKTHDAKTLFDAATTQGLADLVARLRALEHADAACLEFHRAKVRDDATGLLLRLA